MKEKKNKTSKPLYKKWWVWVVGVIVVIAAIQGITGQRGGTQTPAAPVSQTPETEAPVADTSVPVATDPLPIEAAEPLSETDAIKEVIKNRIEEKYNGTDIDSITINEDSGTEETGNYIALVYLTWNVSNSAKTSKEMLEMYSEDLAAIVAEGCSNVQEIAVFWTVPYLNGSAKCAYERKGDGMYLSDTSWLGFE